MVTQHNTADKLLGTCFSYSRRLNYVSQFTAMSKSGRKLVSRSADQLVQHPTCENFLARAQVWLHFFTGYVIMVGVGGSLAAHSPVRPPISTV